MVVAKPTLVSIAEDKQVGALSSDSIAESPYEGAEVVKFHHPTQLELIQVQVLASTTQ